MVSEKLDSEWSPEQVATYRATSGRSVPVGTSAERRSLYVPSRGALSRRLTSQAADWVTYAPASRRALGPVLRPRGKHLQTATRSRSTGRLPSLGG